MCGGGNIFGDIVSATGIGAIYNALIGDPQKKALEEQQRANQIAVESARKQADQADQAFNKANGKTPDVVGITDSNRLNAQGGQSGTMLTGTSGVDPTSLLLGKKTLLGG